MLRDNSNEGDDDEGCVSTENPAPAGTVAPPANELTWSVPRVSRSKRGCGGGAVRTGGQPTGPPDDHSTEISARVGTGQGGIRNPCREKNQATLKSGRPNLDG